jgi:type I site-specific restriction-modification system R (restriction) subunit
MPTEMVSYITHKIPLPYMYTVEWKKIKTKVPKSLWEKVEVLGFDNLDTAVITAFEKLISEPEFSICGKEQEIKIKELEKLLEDEQRHNQELQSKIPELEKRLEDEQRHNQELQRELELRMEESQNQIRDLRKELEKAERREIYFEEMHNNYMMQMQTLINQKQIVAPGAKKPWWRLW